MMVTWEDNGRGVVKVRGPFSARPLDDPSRGREGLSTGRGTRGRVTTVVVGGAPRPVLGSEEGERVGGVWSSSGFPDLSGQGFRETYRRVHLRKDI